MENNLLDDIFSIPKPQKNISSINLLTVCVDYSDFLEETLKYNNNLFNNIYVITSSRDSETQYLSRQYQNITCIVTDIFYENEAFFNKGAAITYSLSKIPNKGWIMIGDADCIFPQEITYDVLNLDKDCLYTYRRAFIKSKKELYSLIESGQKPAYKYSKNTGLVLGYCQIFNFESKFFLKKPYYPTHIKDASKSDVIFSRSWPRNKRKILESSSVIHIGKTNNWKGRKSPKWS